MTARITLTPAQAEAVRTTPVGDIVWLVQESDPYSSIQPVPPAAWVQASQPCVHDDVGPCADSRIELVGPCPDCGGNGWWVDADPDPRTGEPGEPYQVPCQRCHQLGDGNGSVTLAYGYAAGAPLPIVDAVRAPLPQDEGECIAVWLREPYRTHTPTVHFPSDINSHGTPIDLASYGDPASLVGQWAWPIQIGEAP